MRDECLPIVLDEPRRLTSCLLHTVLLGAVSSDVAVCCIERVTVKFSLDNETNVLYSIMLYQMLWICCVRCSDALWILSITFLMVVVAAWNACISDYGMFAYVFYIMSIFATIALLLRQAITLQFPLQMRPHPNQIQRTFVAMSQLRPQDSQRIDQSALDSFASNDDWRKVRRRNCGKHQLYTRWANVVVVLSRCFVKPERPFC